MKRKPAYYPDDEQRARLMAAAEAGTYVDLSGLSSDEYRARLYAMRGGDRS